MTFGPIGPTSPGDPQFWQPPIFNTTVTPSNYVQRCPICEGRTTIPKGFYSGKDHAYLREKCLRCDGKGILIVTSFGTVSKLPSWQD